MRCGNIPRHLHSELAQYLAWVPRVNNLSWEALLFALVCNVYDGRVRLQFVGGQLTLGYSEADYSPEPKETLSMRHIEERYQNEDALLEAVSQGDTNKAFQHIARFGGQPEQLLPERIQDAKHYCVILNTLLRKAVENGYVHPAHIDAVSVDFYRRIEKAVGPAELMTLVEAMISRYCDLVKQFSLRGFSPLIRNVINTVDFNFHEQLSLSSLAEQFNANSSNLSVQFKREKGIPLTDYINAKRFEHAVSLLRSSGLYIEEIAERCGFLDVCYFNRLFKRRFGVPPGEYRKRFND
jgi:YesN/AraC family two-component response regulator